MNLILRPKILCPTPIYLAFFVSIVFFGCKGTITNPTPSTQDSSLTPHFSKISVAFDGLSVSVAEYNRSFIEQGKWKYSSDTVTKDLNLSFAAKDTSSNKVSSGDTSRILSKSDYPGYGYDTSLIVIDTAGKILRKLFIRYEDDTFSPAISESTTTYTFYFSNVPYLVLSQDSIIVNLTTNDIHKYLDSLDYSNNRDNGGLGSHYYTNSTMLLFLGPGPSAFFRVVLSK